MAVFFGQMLFLLLVIVALQDADWLDGTAFGLSALATGILTPKQKASTARWIRDRCWRPAAWYPSRS